MDFDDLFYENGYEATLNDRVVLGDSFIPLTPVPIAASGHLVLEDTSRDNFEVIRYSSKDANGVYTNAGGARNMDGTSTGIHPRGARVRMNITKQDMDAWKLKINDVLNAFTSFSATNGSGWYSSVATISSVVPNGNGSYTLTTGTDQSSVWHPGTRLELTRTVASPTQSAQFNGTTQWLTKTSPANMNMTTGFVAGGWIKAVPGQVTAYAIHANYNGTVGWVLWVRSDGKVELFGATSGANFRGVQSQQSIPTGRWVHVAVQIDMATFTDSATTNYVMIDGQDVPLILAQGGTNPTALTPAANYQIGAMNSTNPANGNIVQTFVSAGKLTQAQVRSIYTQGITPALVTSLNLVSAHSLSNTLNDINTLSANNMTASGGLTTTNNDAPWGQRSNGTISSSLDNAIIQSINGTTVVVQTPEGNTLPSSGGISSVRYAHSGKPYGMLTDDDKWSLLLVVGGDFDRTTLGAGGWYSVGALRVPIGKWNMTSQGNYFFGDNAGNTGIVVVGLGATNASVLPKMQRRLYVNSAGTFSGAIMPFSHQAGLNLAAQTQYFLNAQTQNGNMSNMSFYTSPSEPTIFTFKNTLL